ncbi:hypothetical protein MJ579_15360 [Klebsiella pneumoniae]|nr:hypothetical protein MJ579_15360 [Klebsiella pneumoniae]
MTIRFSLSFAGPPRHDIARRLNAVSGDLLQFRRWDAAKASMNIIFMSPQRDLTLKNVAKAKD